MHPIKLIFHRQSTVNVPRQCTMYIVQCSHWKQVVHSGRRQQVKYSIKECIFHDNYTLLFPMCTLCKVHKLSEEDDDDDEECFVIVDFTTVINFCLNIYTRRIFSEILHLFSLFLFSIIVSKDKMIFHFATFLQLLNVSLFFFHKDFTFIAGISLLEKGWFLFGNPNDLWTYHLMFSFAFLWLRFCGWCFCLECCWFGLFFLTFLTQFT